MDKSLYYNPNQLLSYNRILNFVNGARGLGKTYAMKKRCVTNFINKSEQFIYVRRYKTDLKKVKNYFLDLLDEFPGVKFEVKGREFYINNKLAGYAIPLSSWQAEKSTAYPKVTTILFDEFLIEKSKIYYLPNEVENLLNLMDTIIRTRDNVRVFCLSNATTIVNPYYLYFGLIPDTSKRFYATDDIVIEIPQSLDFSKERKKTKFGRLIDGTEYADMSINNEFTLDNNVFISARPSNSRFMFCVKHDNTTMGVWIDDSTREMYVVKQHNKNAKLHITSQKDNFCKETIWVRNHKENYGANLLVRMFKDGLLSFGDLEVRKYMYEFFKDVRIF